MRRRQLVPREALPACVLAPLMALPIPGGPAHLSGLGGSPVCHLGYRDEQDTEKPQDGQPCSHHMPSMGGRNRLSWRNRYTPWLTEACSGRGGVSVLVSRLSQELLLRHGVPLSSRCPPHVQG